MTSAFCMSNDNQPTNQPARARPDMGGGGGLRGDSAVLLPLPAPSQPLIPSVDQGVSSPTGGGAHMGWALPGTSATLVANLPIQVSPLLLPPPPPPPPPPLPPSSLLAVPPPPTGGKVSVVPQPLGAPLPESLLPLKDCPNPHFCVGGRNHVDFRPPGSGSDLPTREQVEWFTLR